MTPFDATMNSADVNNSPILQLENINSELSSGYLHDLSFTLNYGDDIVLFGPENSGIDSMIKHILGINEDYTGEICYKGKLTREFTYEERLAYKKDIGYLHGEFGLLSNMSVEQNIALPLEYHSRLSSNEVRKTVQGLISEFNLEACKKLRPIDLTSSEILKTAYARAIILDPELLFIEYAFEHQSLLNIISFDKNLKERAHRTDRSVIIVTYRPEKFLDYADVFVMFYNGRIVFAGSREEFLYGNNDYVRQYKNVTEEGPMVML